MDPERQWIARLESETPEDREPPEESPLTRVPRLIAAATVAVGTALDTLGIVDVGGSELKIAILAVVALLVAAVELLVRRAPGRPSLSSRTSGGPV